MLLTSTTVNGAVSNDSNNNITMSVGNTVIANVNSSGIFFESGKKAIYTGAVLQVVYASTGTTTSTTTSTYADTALTASITPSSSANKILVTAYCGQISKTANDLQMNLQLLRGATGILLASALNNNGAVLNASNLTLVVLDSPATTSSTTYKVQIANRDNVGTATFNQNGTATITLMEIAG